ncbi:2-hydroxy-acid oxidase [Marinomonas ushuaiensis DSM 15871]|uniref:2-hydroxy-acid oxidase n=1 Tax=Marinomonas ushuaiensis DSM 15871 TaxID=1122207 RepID=X7E9U8_9GAMM|nr:alpha-hydroxy acid oxidase [Marinomonas ushuaiensis]ETX12645.1 2-hydroxy-acid oxidase [Marinomonas ushuaiensis DSM 15871]
MILNTNDYREKAKRFLPKFAFDYLDGGAEAECTMMMNQKSFTNWGFIPSVLVDCDQCDTRVKWLDHTYSAPFAVAPTGYNGMLRHRADEHLAISADKSDIAYIQSTVSTSSLEDIGKLGIKKHWFQLYILRDREITKDLLTRAKNQGCDTLVVSVDAVYFGNRERDKRHYSKPLKLSWKSHFNIAMHPEWLIKVILPQGMPTFGNLVPYLPSQYQKGVGAAAYFAKQMDPKLDWSTLSWLRDIWPGKLIIKGVMSKSDARKSIEYGCDGIVLSNHGGRQLDGTISPIEMIKSVREVIGQDPLLLVDSGFRRGTDIVKAIALGANGVLIGRPLLYALAAEGQTGATKTINILKKEVERTMAQLGCKTIYDINSSMLKKL